MMKLMMMRVKSEVGGKVWGEEDAMKPIFRRGLAGSHSQML